MEIDNPLLDKAHRSERTPLSNSTNVVPLAKPKRISAKTERLIGELGLRFRPSAQADLEEHAAMLALLTRDVADVPPDLLERAIHQHVTRSPYMPKAAELIALAQGFLKSGEKGDPVPLQALADKYNASMPPETRNRGLHWVVEGSDLKLEVLHG